MIVLINPENTKRNLFAIQTVNKNICIYGITDEDVKHKEFTNPKINMELQFTLNTTKKLQDCINEFSGHTAKFIDNCNIDETEPKDGANNEVANKVIINSPKYLLININKNDDKIGLRGNYQNIQFDNSNYVLVGAIGARGKKYYYDKYDYDDEKLSSSFSCRIMDSSCSKAEIGDEILNSGFDD